MVENYSKLKVSNIKLIIKDVDKICRICLDEKTEVELSYLYNDMLDKKLAKLLGLYKVRLRCSWWSRLNSEYFSLNWVMVYQALYAEYALTD